VRFEHYGDIDVLNVVEVERPVPGPGEALIRVKAAGINPGEASIRKGLMHERWPATFPSGVGSDLAVAGTTAYAAVRAVGLSSENTVVVSGAAGGVGSLAVQLARRAGAAVIGLAGESNHQWLLEHGAVPVAYGDGVAARIREVSDGRVDAFIDTFGGGYVALAIEELGVAPERIDTIIDWGAAEQYGAKAEGTAAAASADVLAELAELIDSGELEVPIAKTFPLDQVRDAYRELERRHTRGKIVLIP
jgi:NADPH:quinone reductase-like Zn-dependent oxidoreductase